MGKRILITTTLVSIYLIIAYSVISSQLAKANPQLSGDGNKRFLSNDFDELRISNNHHAIGRSSNIAGTRPIDGHARATGSNGGGSREGMEQHITNHIGKPLIPLPVTSTPRSSQPLPQSTPTSTHSPQPSRYLPYAGSRVTNSPLSTTTKQQYGNVCRWMSLREFKNIHLDTSELILRDHADRASYILTMRAFIRWTDDDYFPLNNMKALPYVDHVPVLEVPDDGASAHDPRNCSFIAASMADKLAGVPLSENDKRSDTRLYLFKEDPVRFFETHIKIVVDCGYLIFHIQGDGYNLILKSLSFYQNPGSKTQHPPSARSIEADENIQPEHLVFTTKGTRESSLITIPLTSRYTCNRRIVLTGNNSIQLILERFEIQKLMGKLLDSSAFPPPSTTDITTEFKPSLLSFSNMNRHKRYVEFYDIPLCPLNTSVTLVEQCPDSPLNSMMLNTTMMLRKLHPKGKFFADRWTVVSKSSSASGNSHRRISSLLNCVLAIQLIIYCLKVFLGVRFSFGEHI